MWLKLIVDMHELSVEKEPLEEEYRELGGRSLVAQYLLNNVPPGCDPLGPENRLIFCLPLFAGTRLTTGNRISVGAKSPLTGGIKESNSGGYAGSLLAEQGIRLIEIRGKPRQEGMWMLHIDQKGKASLVDAASYRGMNNYEFAGKVQEKYPGQTATLSIGSAGERLYSSASIQVSKFRHNYPSRAAARGGLGAVMGSKGLKALIVEKRDFDLAEAMSLLQKAKDYVSDLDNEYFFKATLFNNFGRIRRLQNNMTDTLGYYRKAKKYAVKTNRASLIVTTFDNLILD